MNGGQGNGEICNTCLLYTSMLRDDMMKNHPEINIVDFNLYNVEAFNPVSYTHLQQKAGERICIQRKI